MNLHLLNDKDLLAQTKQLVQKERKLLTEILHHLREVERKIQTGKLSLSNVTQAQSFFREAQKSKTATRKFVL